MTTRADFSAIKARLTPDAHGWSAGMTTYNTVTAGSCYDRNYLKDFKNLLPGVWVIGQTSYAIGNEENEAYSGRMRLRTRIEFALRIAVRRNAEGVVNNEAEFMAIYNAVCNRLFNWLPSGAESHCFFVAAEDGPPHETYMISDVIFGYVVIKQTDG